MNALPGSIPSRSETAANEIPDEAFETLTRLLNGAERARLERLEAASETYAAALERLPERLPEILERAAQGEGGRRLAQALSAPVAEALGEAVVKRRQSIVDALFPIIGPAIRRAIAEALRNFTADLNRALEQSFSLRGWRWRLEAWRTGVPYAQVVLKHTLSWRIDHLFLIDVGSGVLLHRESAPELPALDADAIAGMLTAIGDFVRDSVGETAADGGLQSASVGEHLLWVVPGPRAYLGCFLRGVPPARLRAVLEARLEELHARYVDLPSARAADSERVRKDCAETLALPSLARDATAADGPAPRSSPWPLRLVLLTALLVAAIWVLRSWWWHGQLGQVRALLRDWPGLILTDLEHRPQRWIRIHGLRDPLAPDPVPRLAQQLGDGVAIHFATRGYTSTDPSIVVARARALLEPPAGVEIDYRQPTLRLSGRAPAAWVASARARAALIAGVDRVDASRLHPDLIALVRQRLDLPPGVELHQSQSMLSFSGKVPLDWLRSLRLLLANEVPDARLDPASVLDAEQNALAELLLEAKAWRLEFASGSSRPGADGAGRIAQLSAYLKQAAALAERLGVQLVVRCIGATDERGTAATNATLRAERATFLYGALVEAGLDRWPGLTLRLPAVQPEAALARGAWIEIELVAKP